MGRRGGAPVSMDERTESRDGGTEASAGIHSLVS